jgi:ATP-dependent helicase HrpB
VQATLVASGLPRSTQVLPLYGELRGDEQDAALAPAPRGERKVVLATNIAETSLTIEGVRVVVDSGLARRAVFDPSTGMSVLQTQRISRASAQQRQGRAGRLEAGVCYRAWGEEAHLRLAPFSPAEILDADLAPLSLELAAWGTRETSELRWLDPPPAAQLASARDLLARLTALDEGQRITAHGREMQRIGAHPRLAHMLLCARALGALPAAAELAALLGERDLLRGLPGSRDADIRSRLALLSGEASPEGVDRGALQRVRRAAQQLAREAGSAPAPQDREAPDAGALLALAYPDRIGRRRAGTEPRYTLANGRGAHFADAQGLARSELIVAVDLDDRERDARILLAAPLTRAELAAHFGPSIHTTTSVEWISREQAVLARRITQLGSLVLEESPPPEVPAEAARAAMLTGIREMGINSLPWDDESRALQARVELVRKLDSKGTWPDLSDDTLAATLDTWIPSWLDGVTRREHLARLPLADMLHAQLTFEQQRQLDTLAPTHLAVPSGSRVRIDYLAEGGPAVAVRLQEVFGLTESPRIVQGRVPLTFQLLSPARRPVQVTRDLASFWRGAYAQVRKDLRGRYPRHHWPENPLEAMATRGTRPRK